MLQISVRLTALLLTLSIGLSVALLDLVLATNSQAVEPYTLTAFFVPLLGCFLLFSGACACLALAIWAIPCKLGLFEPRRALISGGAVLTVLSVTHLLDPTDWGTDGSSGRIAVRLALGLAAFPLVYWALDGLARYPRVRDSVFHGCLSAPVLLLEAFVFQWTGRQWLPWGGFAAFSVLLLFAVIGAGTLWFFAWPGSAKRTLAALVTLSMGIAGATGYAWLSQPEHVHEGAVAAAAPIPHIILLTVDTLRADALSCYGGTTPTPNIDGLVADSVLFTNAYSSAPWTLPSFSSIFTGVSPWVHQATKMRQGLPAGLNTLGEKMAGAGYLTGGIGFNFFLTQRGGGWGVKRGFAEYNFYPQFHSPRTAAMEVLASRNESAFDLWATTDDLTRMAKGWVRGHESSGFFFWLHYLDPHMPYMPPEKYFPGGELNEAAALEYGSSDALDRFRSGHMPPTEEAKGWLRDLYHGEVRHVDDRIGSFLSVLKETGIYDDALIIFTSDHGEEHFDHAGVDHGHTLYDELLRVPLAFKLPGSPKTGKVEPTVGTVSILPTILELAGIDFTAGQFSGSSLVPYWDQEFAEDQIIFSTGAYVFEERESVIFEGWKYIRSLISGAEELYNLRADPKERDNLAAVDHERIAKAHALLRANEAHAEQLRKHYGLKTGAKGAELTEAERRLLRSLGYVQ